ncbi:MAG: glycerol-3-phosphate dehydrogenase [Thermoleophilaceae bacterium]|jgi:glycerol-3-phosphate dehydrogenase (NAD(P)+)|nr:glycerol-3-phosphate dehydrogenase [Thermoleophilaceae bacterium]
MATKIQGGPADEGIVGVDLMSQMSSVAVIGAGSWGTTVASLVAHNGRATLWARDPGLAAEIDKQHTNSRYLGDAQLAPGLAATGSIEEAVTGAGAIVMAVPSHGYREVLERVAPHCAPGTPVISLTKGLEQGSRLRMTEVTNEVLPDSPAGVLTGPNLAREVLAGQAAAAVLAMPEESVAEELQPLFSSDLFRVYRSEDVVGAEVAGAIKNVFAVAAGMASGLSTGDNTRATVICRAIAEMTRLGVSMGGESLTFAGLAGMGDLIATCISPLSRNRRVGEELAAGKTVDEITAGMNMVAEGIKTTPVFRELADEFGVEMPIVNEVDSVLKGESGAADAYRGLLARKPATEFKGVPA